jgi:hypothetical protein
VNGKHLIKVYKGIKNWYAYCPTCRANNTAGINNGNFNQMIDTAGLVNFEQAEARQKDAEGEYAVAHPNHQSKWDATIETVKEHNRTEETEYE